MILLGLGANLPSAAGGPRETLLAALRLLEEQGVRILARSPWYRTAPVPASDQPWYWNGVASAATDLPPDALLALLHATERNLGRVRGERNAARSCDLDILDYEARVSAPGESPILPHPRLHQRGFVLLPLRDLAPGWRHPVLGRSIAELIAALPPGEEARRADSD